MTQSQASGGIRLRGRFRHGDQPLFDDLDLKLEGGQWTCLLGPSGVGKSTILRVIAGLDTGGVFDGSIDTDDGSATWSWEEMHELPQTELTVDIHCVTKWSKLDTDWSGVSIDTLLNDAGISTPSGFVMAYCDGGYTTNMPVADVIDGKALLAHRYDGKPLAPEHGGPVRLFIPHLYLWKSAKWIRSLNFVAQDAPGFWERNGYHMYGDPWREQRYTGD